MRTNQQNSLIDWQNWSFITRLALVMIILIAITLFTAFTISIRSVQTALTEQTAARFEADATKLSDVVSLFFLEKISQLQTVALSDAIIDQVISRNNSYDHSDPVAIQATIKELNSQWISAEQTDPFIVNMLARDRDINPSAYYLSSFLDNFDDHVELFVTDQYGATVGSTGLLSDYEQADEGWWQAGWNEGIGAVYISEPEFDTSAGVTALLISVPIRDPKNDAVIGVLRSTLIVDELFAIIESAKFGDTGHVIILDQSAEVLFDPFTKINSVASYQLDEKIRKTLITQSGSLVAEDESGEDSIFGFTPVSLERIVGQTQEYERLVAEAVTHLGWTIAVRQKSSEALTSSASISQNGWIIGVIAVAIAGLTAYLVAHTITLPLINLSTVAEKIGAGALDTPLPEAGTDEIGKLTSSFNYMTERLRQNLTSLENKSSELEKSNKELEQFAYIASHDLKAPLRAISSLSQWIAEDLEELLTPETREQMDMLLSRVERMESLINGILNYAHAGQKSTEAVKEVDLNQLLRTVIKEIAPPSEFQFNITPNMPTILTNEIKLSQIFTDLISNSIKYHHQAPNGHIQISYSDQTDFHQFSVTDDGPGIAPEFHEKIFIIFQTLQPRDKIESTGVGLSIVKKIVEDKGGQIWVKSAEGEGATFTFTWPKNIV